MEERGKCGAGCTNRILISHGKSHFLKCKGCQVKCNMVRELHSGLSQWEWMSSQQDGIIASMHVSERTQTFHMPSSFTLLTRSGYLSLCVLDILPLPLLPFSLQIPHHQWLGVIQGPVSYAPFWNISCFSHFSSLWRSISQIYFLFGSIWLLRPIHALGCLKWTSCILPGLLHS